MANYLDQAGDLIRRLTRAGVPEEAAVAAARAAQNAPPAPVRQLELPLGDNAARAMPTPPAAPRFDDIVLGDAPAAPDMSLGSPLWHQMDKGARGYENIVKGRTGNLRNQNPDLVQIARDNINSANAAAAARMAPPGPGPDFAGTALDIAVPTAVVAGATYATSQLGQPRQQAAAAPKPSQRPETVASDAPPASPRTPIYPGSIRKPQDLDSTGGTADLANESRPVPQVETTTSPRDQAQALIAQLNQMRRDAGGEVPQAKQMMAEINRLMALSNEQRNATPAAQAAASDDPHMRAQALISQLNEMRRRAGREVPQAAQIMAEVRRLQALGDQRRNAAQTR